jgi:hypothetical protein
MQKRGSYFFVLDALIGGIIILIALVTVIDSYGSSQSNEQPLTLVQDMLTYLRNTEVRDFQGTYTQQLLNDGNITDPERTLLEQTAAFHRTNNLTAGRAFLDEIISEALPPQYGVQFIYNASTSGGTVMYERAPFARQDAATSLSVRRSSILLINKTTIYGPHPVEVSIWLP